VSTGSRWLADALILDVVAAGGFRANPKMDRHGGEKCEVAPFSEIYFLSQPNSHPIRK